MKKRWFLGEYIQRLLERKGGKRSGWHASRLSQETGLAYSHIHYILTGEASGKKDAPSPSIDVFLKLEKALNVPIINLIVAYTGKDPEAEAPKDRINTLIQVRDVLDQYISQADLSQQ